MLFRAYFIRAKEYAEKNTTLGRATSILHQFNGEEHLNRFSCNFFRQFKYTIAGVLPIVRYSFSALWQMNSRYFLQVKGHQIKRPREPEKKKIQTKNFVTSNFRSHLNKLKRMWMNSCSSLSQWFLVCYIQLQKGKIQLILQSVKDERCILHSQKHDFECNLVLISTSKYFNDKKIARRARAICSL